MVKIESDHDLPGLYVDIDEDGDVEIREESGFSNHRLYLSPAQMHMLTELWRNRKFD